jgi:hypothetical protein
MYSLFEQSHTTCLPAYLLIYSCCFHLEHRAPLKRFVSLQFLNLRRSAGLLGRGTSPTQGRYLHRTAQTQNKRRQSSMPWMGFEPTIPAFEGASFRQRGGCDRPHKLYIYWFHCLVKYCPRRYLRYMTLTMEIYANRTIKLRLKPEPSVSFTNT